jgi:hypothetical protein
MLFEVKHLIPGIGILVSKVFIVKEIGHDLYKVKNRGWIADLKSKFREKKILGLAIENRSGLVETQFWLFFFFFFFWA